MSRKRQRPYNATPTPSPSTPWYKHVWVVLSILGAGVFGLLINGPSLVANAEKLPGEIERVSARFLSWYYDDDAWSGIWSANPEGYIDSEDMHLSQTDLHIHLTPERGRLGGEIAVRSICRTVPMLDYFLLEGTVSGDTATITAFDFIGGSRKNFFRFTAKRDGVVLLVTLKEGDSEWLPSQIRIGLHPKVEGEDPYKLLSGFCSVEREALKKAIRKSKGEGMSNPSLQRTLRDNAAPRP